MSLFKSDKQRKKVMSEYNKGKPKKTPRKFQYSIIKMKYDEDRLGTFKTREDAIMRMNKLKEAHPDDKYKIRTERLPKKQGW